MNKFSGISAMTVLAVFAGHTGTLSAQLRGMLANPGFVGQQMKSVYFFAGDWRAPAPGEPFYDGLTPASNECLYSIHPLDFHHLGWSEAASNREYAVNLMLGAGVNVVNMSYWGPPGTDRWAFSAPMQTATGAHDQIFDTAVGKPLLIAPYIEDADATIGLQHTGCNGDQGPLGKSQAYHFMDDFPGTQDNPAPQLVAQIVDLVKRYKLQPANPAWPDKWAQMFDQNGIPRYVISIIHVGSNNLQPSGSGPPWNPNLPDQAFAYAFTWAANRVYSMTGVNVGFTLDVLPAEHTVPFKPTPERTGPLLAQQPSVLAIQMFNPEVYTGLCAPPPSTDSCDAIAGSPTLDRLAAWKRTLIAKWVGTAIPVILDVSPGYDERIISANSRRYGNNDSWRNHQSGLLSLGVRGLTANTWNGYTEGYAIVPSCGLPPGLLCSSGNPSDEAYRWFQNLIPPGSSPARQPAMLSSLGPSSGNYAQMVAMTATLTEALTRAPLSGRTVQFQLGSQTVSGTTDAKGVATARVTLNQPPGSIPMFVSFAGDSTHLSISAAGTFTIVPNYPYGSMSPSSGPGDGGTIITVTGGNFSTVPGETVFTFEFASTPEMVPATCATSTVCTITSPRLVQYDFLVSVSATVTRHVSGKTSSSTGPIGNFFYTSGPAGPPGSISDLTFDPVGVGFGDETTGTVTIVPPVSGQAVTIALTCDRPDLASVPASATVPAGKTSASFWVTTLTPPGLHGKNATLVYVTASSGSFTRVGEFSVGYTPQ